MATNAEWHERALFLLAFGGLLLALALGTLFWSYSMSMQPVNFGEPDTVASSLLFVAGAILVTAGLLLRRRHVS